MTCPDCQKPVTVIAAPGLTRYVCRNEACQEKDVAGNRVRLKEVKRETPKPKKVK